MRRSFLRTLGPLAALALALILPPVLRAEDGPAPEAPPAPAPTPAPEPDDVPVPEPPPKVMKTFKSAEVRSHVFFFASKKCAGRASGAEGCDTAGEYILDLVEKWGLEPAGVGGAYKQEFQVRLLPFGGQGSSDNPVGGEGTTFNVCAVVPGSDEKLKDEYVVLTAHYDHVGRRSKRKIFFGADDNGSGSSALLQVARAFAEKDAPRPRRSILFIWCSAEERGLLGSKWFVDHPTVPLANVVCDLNIDMVGRNASKELHVYGNASSPDLNSAHLKATEKSGFKFLVKTGSIFLRSDQVNFYRADIPCLFWTSGLHKDYHATSDTAQRIDTGKVSRAALHAYVTAWEIANRTKRPRFTKMDPNASAGPLGAILDLVPRELLPERIKLKDGAGAALIQTVMDGGPAAKAKLKPGDFIVGIGKRTLPEDDPVSAVEEAVQKAADKDKGKGKITLRFVRGRRTLKVTIKL